MDKMEDRKNLKQLDDDSIIVLITFGNIYLARFLPTARTPWQVISSIIICYLFTIIDVFQSK